jgi:hypothetical protein
MVNLENSEAAGVQTTMDYVLARLATCFGQKADNFADFIAMGLRAEGWYATEAVRHLSGPAAGDLVKVEQVRGPAQGDAGFNPDLQLNIGGQSYQLAIKPMLLQAEADIPHYFSQELPDLFRWLGSLGDRAALLTIAFPCSTADKAWTDAVGEAEASYGVKVTGQTEFVVPRPPLPMVKACVALWRHSSAVPAAEGDAS